MLGEVAFGVPMGRQAGAAGRGRGRAVIVYNPRGVTHFIPYHSTRVFPPTSLHARTHCASRPTLASPAHPPSCTHSPGRTLFFAHCFFFVAYLCGVAYFYTRMNNQSLIDSLNAELQSAHAEVLAIRAAGIFGKARLAACKRVIVALEALNAAQKASK